jgi:dTDP-4-amino-4,6-dideoxygalactose transaminase
MFIPFNKPCLSGNEFAYIRKAYKNFHLSGDGEFTGLCSRWLEERTGCNLALLTNSCTAALEMTAILIGIQSGDEVIMPSFTFVSTANAFVLRGGVPVFVDIRRDTLNIDETLIEDAITAKTKAIVVVHYAGVSCEMDKIMDIASRHQLKVIEDSAHGLSAYYKGRPLGSIGHLGCYSFHETKNIICGEGGALLVNDPSLAEAAKILWQKGTNRSQFMSGQVDKYTWVACGSSFLLSEISAAFLWSQMNAADEITRQRVNLWNRYHDAFESLEIEGFFRRPIVPDNCDQNGHMYYILLIDKSVRANFIETMHKHGVGCVFHYVPLHSSPGGLLYSRSNGGLNVTNLQSERLVRLPMFFDLSEAQQNLVIDAVIKWFK